MKPDDSTSNTQKKTVKNKITPSVKM